MGIKDLWSVLQPYCERKPLYELQGKIVAIDLAGWVCESLCVLDYEVQPRFYLRNLFFRTCFLVLSGVTPVFVLEGDAPPLKYGVICQRNATQFRGARPRNDADRPKKPAKGRSRFNHVLKQCEDLLVSMGLQCVQGPGEAEAFCAYMNQDRMVDGIISQDSDCFAYGATKVYRNFSVSMQGQVAAQGGAVDVYDLARVCEDIDFGQHKMIAMALLCGCDYCPDGVPGVGRDAVTKFFGAYTNAEVLDRIKSWRANADIYTSLELKVDDKSVCVNCGHYGRVQAHAKTGCGQCRQKPGCDAGLWKNQRLAIKSELQLRRKAVAVDEFPSQAIIDEFLCRPVNLPKLDLKWRQPNLIKFLRFMSKLLQWEEIYCFQKCLPLLTRWQLFHHSNAIEVCTDIPLKGCLSPAFIKKKRAPKGVASYEIIWEDDQNCFTGLIPEEQLKTYMQQNSLTDPQHLWSTIEPQDLVEKAYPKLVETFLAPKLPTKGKKAKKKANPCDDDDATKAKKPTRPKRTKANENQPPPAATGNMLIDRFFKKTKTARAPAAPNVPVLHQSPKIQTSCLPMNLSNFSIEFDDGHEFDEHDLSDAIRNIVARPPHATQLLGRKLRFEEVDDNPETSSANVSFNEFDLMLKRAPPRLQEQDSSTPLRSQRQSGKRRSSKLRKVPAEGNSKANVDDGGVRVNSHFFGDVTASVDAFEQSLDFHNIPDDFGAASIYVDENDTFGLENYVPVGAKLGKKFRGNVT